MSHLNIPSFIQIFTGQRVECPGMSLTFSVGAWGYFVIEEKYNQKSHFRSFEFNVFYVVVTFFERTMRYISSPDTVHSFLF